ncbi:MAG: segregation/condensation protein A [Paenibacillaceae bacterium]
MKVTYKLESFEGPLDLLLHLIDKSEVDIYNIPIKVITDQYMAYLGEMQEMELNVTSEFLVMAATLLYIKSKMLLPKPPPMTDLDGDYDEEGEDPRAELVRQLLEYRKFKGIADHLREKELERSLIYTREPLDLTPYQRVIQENPVKGLFPSDLMIAFQKVLRRVVSRNVVTKIKRDEISVKERIKELILLLQSRGGKVLFSKLFDAEVTREDIVVTFLAMLELMKMKVIVCYQHKLFDDIVIQAREDEIVGEFKADEVNY